MKELGLQPNDMPAAEDGVVKLFAAGNAAIAKINPPLRGLGGPDRRRSLPRVGWAPNVDGMIVNVRSFFDTAPMHSKNVR